MSSEEWATTVGTTRIFRCTVSSGGSGERPCMLTHTETVERIHTTAANTIQITRSKRRTVSDKAGCTADNASNACLGLHCRDELQIQRQRNQAHILSHMCMELDETRKTLTCVWRSIIGVPGLQRSLVPCWNGAYESAQQALNFMARRTLAREPLVRSEPEWLVLAEN